MTEEHPREVHVTIGKVEIGSGPVLLKAILGSCVGIGVLWRARGLYGLAHCLLADAPTGASANGARYVSQAVPSLLRLMEIGTEHRKQIDVILAGGGNMTASESKSPMLMVGAINVASAERCLRERRLHVVHRDVGGEAGRRVQIDCRTGKFEVEEIPRIQ